MPTIYIDNEPYMIAEEGKNLLEVCLSLGFDLPYFCWHPAMHSVGACRQCAVKQFKNEQDTRGRIVMACETPAKDGTRISINDPEVVNFRRSITEWMMVNHPHDCPVCDEGGECHLQDMTVMTGHVYRRARFPKRTYHSQGLGPFVNHEMNRCIQCYRCVRFYNEYAGGRDFGVFGWHDHVYFGRATDGVLESEFSGNLVEVCPTGVFTDKTQWRHYVRKWDLQTAPSICVHCGLGCNTIPGERYGKLRRLRNRYNGQVNGYFLCDRGRYGYEFVNSPQRIVAPLIRMADGLQQVSKDEALTHLAGKVRTGKVIGIGSPRASLEANFALRSLVGKEHFYLGMAQQQQNLLQQIITILQSGPARTPTQQEVARADAVLILGEDVNNVAPMLAFSLRQAAMQAPKETLIPQLRIAPFSDYPIHEAIQDERSPFFIASPWVTRLDDEARAIYRATPDDLARFGFAVAHELDSAAPPVANCADDVLQLAKQVADALKLAKRPVIVSGCSCGSSAVIQAAANVAWALHKTNSAADLCFTVPECNSVGLALLQGGSIDTAAKALRPQNVDTVIILENDLYHQLDKATADAILTSAQQVIVLDHVQTATTAKATAVLPAATFAESDGTLINSEGRAQRYFQVFVPAGDIQESWRWLDELMVASGKTSTITWPVLDHLLASIAREFSIFHAITEIAQPADFRIVGQKIARQSHRNSGRTAITANVEIHEPPPPPDPDTALDFSMEGFQGQPPSPLIPRFWAPGWNSVQSVNKFQSEVGGPLRGGDPGRRLIEPAKGAVKYFTDIPPLFTPRKDQWLIIPAYHVFGSELLSLFTPGIADLAPEPYLMMNEQEAQHLGLTAGQHVEVVVERQRYDLPVQLAPLVPTGIAAVPVGLPALRGLALPAWGRILAAEQGEEAQAV
ncbi:MAG TPA: NADH-quinone oxidoreductase subunit NuoG [Armatimonadota bacterium]|nr:NADH-quinone oxidoreductase subunit NuoG [Armatimonadota bacterium]